MKLQWRTRSRGLTIGIDWCARSATQKTQRHITIAISIACDIRIGIVVVICTAIVVVICIVIVICTVIVCVVIGIVVVIG